jgi:hypothetical protein
LCNSVAKNLGLIRGDDPHSRIVVEREHRDGRLADGEGWRCHDRRDQAFESLTGLRELC